LFKVSPGKLLIRDVVDEGLCLSCGLCAVVCKENVIRIKDEREKFHPELVKECESFCGKCFNVCPGKEVDIFKLQKFLFGKNIFSILGNVEKIGVGYSNDRKVRYNASSGGVVSIILKYLIEKEIIQQAIVMGFNEEKPYLAEYKIINGEKEILESSQSKYVVNHLANVLRNVSKKVAIVALPCQIHGIRKLEMLEKNENIEYLFGLYCGNNLYFEATKAAISRLGIKKLEEVEKVRYREGPWPGYFEVVSKDKIKRRMSKDAFNYFSLLYTMPRCNFCFDLTNEFADISFGDAWNYEGKSRKGYTVIISRTKRGNKLLDELIEQNVISFMGINEKEAIVSHAHHLKRKKNGIFYRMEIMKNKGKRIPEYHIKFKEKFNKIYFLKEKIILSLMNKVFLKLVLNFMPLIILEFIMRNLRRLWKKMGVRRISLDWNILPYEK